MYWRSMKDRGQQGLMRQSGANIKSFKDPNLLPWRRHIIMNRSGRTACYKLKSISSKIQLTDLHAITYNSLDLVLNYSYVAIVF